MLNIMMISTMPDNILCAPRQIGTWQMATIFQQIFNFYYIEISCG